MSQDQRENRNKSLIVREEARNFPDS
jgi:hypothetical protein